MGEPKPIASLSGLLLARKGAARPAMRRPTAEGNVSGMSAVHEDLGWNDMGYDVDPDQTTPMDHDHGFSRNPLANAVPEANSVVREQQQMIARQLEAQAEVGFESVPSMSPHVPLVETPVSVADAVAIPVIAQKVPVLNAPALAATPVMPTARSTHSPRKRAAPGSKGKAAFTLRLDTERHLKLRLACAVGNRSAQMLVTDALDAFLESMPEIAQLAARIPANK
jgi:hypothetical protein